MTTRSADEILADVVQLVVGTQAPISLLGGKVALGTGYEAWQRLRNDVAGTSFGWFTAEPECVDRLRAALSTSADDGPLRIVVESAVERALPSEMLSTFDSVAKEVLDALRTAGYAVVRV